MNEIDVKRFKLIIPHACHQMYLNVLCNSVNVVDMQHVDCQSNKVLFFITPEISLINHFRSE